MNSEIANSKGVLKKIREQHLQFLQCTSIWSEDSARIREQLSVLESEVNGLHFDIQKEREKLKTSSVWLSTSLSLKHNEAVRTASAESQKASFALKENTAAMRAIAHINREDTFAMKENTSEMKLNGALLRELVEETLKSNQALRKITEMNAKESATITQIAVNTQKDGQSMKFLKFLTTMYLPAAFVSSIFGRSIISFDVSEDETQMLVVAKQWWIYVVSTAILTIFTIIGSFLWIKKTQSDQTIKQAQMQRIVEDQKTAKNETP
ncbi:hypothetical protein TWF694_011046 [Orbilia ellipsospora]|uniref:Uncharacterized protein n=1 Tax=Orbilia ellipsospora TaxID=2528407 RepID=A0AAV9X7V4_9PEZI